VKAQARRLSSLRNRLALLFFAVTAFALAVVIFVFLPQLESKIERQKLGDLEATASRTAPRLRGLLGAATGKQVDRAARVISDRSGARVTLLGIQRSSRSPVPRFYVISDSNQLTSVAADWPLALRAVESGRDRPM
jgi:sensor histidine kinase regulating citrate/malate metabolism